MRHLSLLCALLAGPASAWEFEPTPVCTIWHDTGSVEMRVTYDPAEATPYAITVTRRGAPWPDAPVYTITFEGPQSFTISTNRHQLSSDGQSVTAQDTGFGNVLAGLERGVQATAFLGEMSAIVPLDGAAEEVAKFRDCTQPGMV